MKGVAHGLRGFSHTLSDTPTQLHRPRILSNSLIELPPYYLDVVTIIFRRCYKNITTVGFSELSQRNLAQRQDGQQPAVMSSTGSIRRPSGSATRRLSGGRFRLDQTPDGILTVTIWSPPAGKGRIARRGSSWTSGWLPEWTSDSIR